MRAIHNRASLMHLLLRRLLLMVTATSRRRLRLTMEVPLISLHVRQWLALETTRPLLLLLSHKIPTPPTS